MERKKGVGCAQAHMYSLNSILAALLLLAAISGCSISPFRGEPSADDAISAELLQLGIGVKGERTVTRASIPEDLVGPDWGLKKAVCSDAGYRLQSFAGSDVNLHRQATDKHYGGSELAVWIAEANGKVICVYYTAPGMMPGVFSVKDPSIG